MTEGLKISILKSGISNFYIATILYKNSFRIVKIISQDQTFVRNTSAKGNEWKSGASFCLYKYFFQGDQIEHNFTILDTF